MRHRSDTHGAETKRAASVGERFAPSAHRPGPHPATGFTRKDDQMKPARAFFASMSMSLLVLTLSYQAAALPAMLAPPPQKPATDAWMNNTAVPKKGSRHDDMSELVPLVEIS